MRNRFYRPEFWLALAALLVGPSFALSAQTPPAAPAPAASPAYNTKQSAALAAALKAEIGASTALAGEDWVAWLKAKPALFQALAGLQAAFGFGGFQGALKQAVFAWPALAKADDFAHARSAFVKLSDQLAQVILQARPGDPALAQAVVYYCPMTSDPANARWVQAAPPLRNPFWGKEMLECGAEFKP